MKSSIIIILLILSSVFASGQNIGINETGSNPDNSAILDVQSTTKGLLIPRMTTAQRHYNTGKWFIGI